MSYIKLFKAFWHYAGKDRWKVVLLIALHASSISALLLIPYIFAQLLNSIQILPLSEILTEAVFWILIWIGIMLWHNFIQKVGRYFEFDVGYRVKQRFLNKHYEILTQLPLKWHTENHSGETINRINLAASTLQGFATNQVIYVREILMFWGPIVALYFISWQIALASFVVAMVMIAIIRVFDKYLVRLYRRINKISHKISATFLDYVSNIKTVITLHLGSRTRQDLNSNIERGYKPYMQAEAVVNALKWFTVSLGIIALQAGALFYYIWQQVSKEGFFLVGNVVAMFQYLERLCGTFGNIAGTYQIIIRWRINFEEIEHITRELVREKIYEKPKIKNFNQIEICNLTFSYEKGKKVLDDVSFLIKKHSKIALVGESGSGKSSLMAVLRRLYEPEKVSLTIDGKSFNNLRFLSGLTTLIPQDPEFFENTIRYNITFGLDYPDEKVMAAVKMAGFDKVMKQLPRGLDSDIREKGVTLSGGERQRLALARGLLAAQLSPIILMDEPTSSVDTQNEMRIFKNIFKAYHDRTIICSVHRLHLLSSFDHIILLDKGKIIQTGTFEDLLGQKGIFQTLWFKYKKNAKF